MEGCWQKVREEDVAVGLFLPLLQLKPKLNTHTAVQHTVYTHTDSSERQYTCVNVAL